MFKKSKIEIIYQMNWNTDSPSLTKNFWEIIYEGSNCKEAKGI